MKVAPPMVPYTAASNEESPVADEKHQASGVSSLLNTLQRPLDPFRETGSVVSAGTYPSANLNRNVNQPIEDYPMSSLGHHSAPRSTQENSDLLRSMLLSNQTRTTPQLELASSPLILEHLRNLQRKSEEQNRVYNDNTSRKDRM
jgi:hypothetical protein